VRPVYWLSIFIPVAVGLRLADAPATAVFATSAIGVVPTAALMSDSTEQLAERAGPGVGGLLNVTFGNAPELIIAFFALIDGLQEVVKASLIGSVLGNSLLVFGAAILVGGLRHGRPRFNPAGARIQAALVLAALAAFAVPTLMRLAGGGGLPNVGEERHRFSGGLEGASLGLAIALIAGYAVYLWFSLRTHRQLFAPWDEDEGEPDEHVWTVRRSVLLLALGGALVGVMSEILVGSIEKASAAIGLTQFFVGAIVVAIVGNAAEHYVAVVAAAKDKMDLTVNIALGSSVQIALFVAPVLVVLSFLFGPFPLALVLNGYEIVGLVAAGAVANLIAARGGSTWQEGAAMLALYTALVVAFVLA
jgi:Ca2+:H+ antiporter